MTKLPIAKMACILFVFFVAATIEATAQTYTDLYDMGATSADPNDPVWAGVIARGRDGNMYSTTPQFWTGGGGDVFKITPAGKVSVLYSFDLTGRTGNGGLTLATDGNFYGATPSEGAFPYGRIFKITPEGSLTTLYSFTNGADGANPTAPPIEGLDGNFYGTTGAGGEGLTHGQYGSVYKITPSGVFTTLHTFANTDGANPLAPLLEATDSVFYGTTFYGGTSGAGTIFRITASGQFEVVYNFGEVPGYPIGGLTQGDDGDLYGTTCGAPTGASGVAFKFAYATRKLTVLQNLGNAGGDSGSTLMQATDGKFYGTTSVGQSIFRVSSTGSDFESWGIGGSPQDTPFQHTNGVLYGTNAVGGAYDAGVFYSFDVGLKPFVSFLPVARPVGQVAEILGQGFTGATSVSFNGTAATFTVESNTYLTATVPAGAISGFVTVTTPGGTLKSNKAFRVTPQIFSVSQSSGPVGTTLIVTGESFTKTYAVTFGVPKATFTVDSDTQLTVTVPPGAETTKFAVLTSGGTAYSPDCFVVTP
jgi:uncharacterized repeat protein (TIGR03803 family)